MLSTCEGYKEIYCSINTRSYPERGKDAQINIAAALKIYLFASEDSKLTSKLGHIISFYLVYKRGMKLWTLKEEHEYGFLNPP